MTNYDPATINRRAEFFDYDTIQSSPTLVAKILKMSLPDHHVQGLAQGIRQTINYVNQQNMLAGVPGALNVMRLKALNIQQPEVRAQGLDLVNKLQTLAPEQQNLALSYLLQNKVQGAPLNPNRAIPEGAGSATASAISALNYGQDVSVGQVGTYEDASGQMQNLFGLHLTGEGNMDINRLAAMKLLFPEGGARASLVPLDDPGWTETYNRLVAVPVSRWVAGGGIPGTGSFARAVGDAEYGITDPVTGKHRFLSSREIISQTAKSIPGLALAAAPVSQPFLIAGAAAPAVSSVARSGYVPGGTAAANLTGSAEETVFGTINTAMGKATDPMLKATGAKPGSREYEQGDDMLKNIFMIAGGHFIGEVFKDIKTSRSLPPDLAIEELGIGESPLAARPTRTILGSEALGKVASIPGRVLDVPDYFTAKSMNRLFQRGVDEWVSSKYGRRLLTNAADAVSSGEGLARLTKQYGNTMPRDLADILVNTPEAMRPQALLDYLKYDTHANAVTAAKTQLDAVNAEIEAVNAGETARLAPAEGATTPPGVPSLSSEAAARVPEGAQVEWVRVDDLRSNARKMSTSRYDEAGRAAYLQEIQTNGFPEPIEVRYDPAHPENAHIGNGNHQLDIAAEAGIEYVPVYTTNPANTLELGKLSEISGGKFRTYEGAAPSAEPAVEIMGPDGEWMPLDAAMHDPTYVPRRLTDLELQKSALEAELRRPAPEPVVRYPKVQVVRAATLGVADTRLGKILGYGLNRTKIIDPYDLVNELPQRPRLVNMAGDGAPLDGLGQNVDTLIKVMRRLKIPDEVAAEWINKTDALGKRLSTGDALPQEWFEHYKTMMDTIVTHLPADTPAWLKTELSRTAQQAVEGRTHSMMKTADGAGVEPVLAERLPDGSLRPLPSRQTEFMGDIQLPDVDLMVEATSVIRRSFRTLKSSGLLGRYAADVMYYWPRKVLEIATRVGKSSVLGTRPIAMSLRQQLEQTLRASQYGLDPLRIAPEGFRIFPGGMPLPFKDARLFAGLFGEEGLSILGKDPRLEGIAAPTGGDVGSIVDQLSDSRVVRVPSSTADYNLGRATPDNGVYDGWLDAIEQAKSDWFDSRLARPGYGVENLLREGETSPAMRQLLDQQLSVIKRSTIWEEGMSDAEALTKWAERRVQYLNELTGGDPEILRGISHGKFGAGSPSGRPVNATSGRDFMDTYTARTNDLDSITSNLEGIERTDANFPTIRALQRERLDILNQIEEMERAYPDLAAPTAGKPVSVDTETRGGRRDGRAFLREKFEGQSVDLPGQVVVKKGYAPSSVEGDGTLIDRGLDRMDELSSRYSQTMYKMLKPASWLDLKGTRGSVFYDLVERNLAKYQAAGMNGADAMAWAQVHAGTVTRDIMYDLEAKTSAQRAVKDIFWFAPATQEILWTWLWKIPSESYPIAGHAALALKGAGFLGLLRDSGLVQKDPEGNDIVVVPGVAKLIERITGAKVPEITFGKVSGLTFINPAAPSVSLSTLPAIALGKATEKWGGPFKDLSKIFLPYGTQVGAVPQQLTFAWESLTGTPFPLEWGSPGLAKRQFDTAYDQGIQYALAELNQQGVKAPNPDDFADTKGPDGKPSLSAAAEEKYRAASAAYVDSVMSLGKEYLQGTAMVKLLGSTVSPMALYSSTQAKDDLSAFFNSLPKDAEGNLPDDISTQLGTFLDEHPNSEAYAVFYGLKGTPDRDLPWVSTGDEKIWDDYLTGARSAMPPAEFARHVQTVESYRVFGQQYEAALRSISPTLNPVELLTNGWKKTQALAELQRQRELYEHLNPGAAGEYKQAQLGSSMFHKGEPGWLPPATFQAERLASTISNLQQLSGMFTGETGIRYTEFRSALTQLKIAYSDEATFGAPTTATEKAMAKYMTGTLVPYAEETGKLYDQASKMTAAGLDATPIYDQIAAINKRYADKPTKIGGQDYPPPEAVFFGNKTPGEQDSAVYHWLAQPVYWMDDFRFKQAGLTDFEGRGDFLSAWGKLETDFRTRMDQAGLTSSSTDYARNEQLKNQAVAELATQYGTGAQQLLSLNNAPPLFRLGTTGFGQGNANWAAMTQMTGSVWTRLVQDGVSPAGYSQEAVYYKQWLFQRIEQMKASDPEFARLWTKLSYSVPDKGMDQKLGSPLYDAILFGAYSSQYIPTSLAGVAAPGLGVPSPPPPLPLPTTGA